MSARGRRGERLPGRLSGDREGVEAVAETEQSPTAPMKPAVSLGPISLAMPPIRWIGTCGLPVRLRMMATSATL